LEVGFALNPVLAAPEVPQLRSPQGDIAAPRLGWNTWLAAASAGRRADAADAEFEETTA
jgi:type VI secretion system protein ImpH